MQANPILLQHKYARIVKLFAEQTGLTYEQALDFFYNSKTFELISEGVADMQRSDYWFILRSALEGKTIDFNRCQKSTDKSANVYRKYPNVPKGKLIIKIEPNLPYDFKCVPNLSLGANTLFSRGYRVKEEGKDPYNNYIVNIPSLTYKSVGPIWVDKVEVSTLGTPFLIYKKDGTCVSTSQTTMELKK